MRNLEIAGIFNQIADLLEIQGANPFRIRAYRRAADNLENLTDYIEVIARQGTLRAIPGIGEDLASKIAEYIESGKMEFFEQLKKEVPPGLARLVDIPSVGPKTAKQIYDLFHIQTIDELEELCKTEKLLGAPEFKKKTVENILRGIAIYRRRKGIRILAGTEVDIRQDGTLDYSDELLGKLDFVVASVHSGFKQDRATLTNPVVRAMQNPHVRVIGHPTGRLLGDRDAYDLGFDEVMKEAARTRTCLEVNSNVHRLDLSDVLCRKARDMGVHVIISTDSHDYDDLLNLPYGVATAQRGWTEKERVLNARPVEELLSFKR